MREPPMFRVRRSWKISSGAGRAVAFDSIPIGFVGAIKVTKSNLPEQDAEALGGTIDITPKTAPSDGRPFADIKLGTGEELLRHSWITDLAGTAGMRFGGGNGGYNPFSVLVTASGVDAGESTASILERVLGLAGLGVGGEVLSLPVPPQRDPFRSAIMRERS